MRKYQTKPQRHIYPTWVNKTTTICRAQVVVSEKEHLFFLFFLIERPNPSKKNAIHILKPLRKINIQLKEENEMFGT